MELIQLFLSYEGPTSPMEGGGEGSKPESVTTGEQAPQRAGRSQSRSRGRSRGGGRGRVSQEELFQVLSA